ncbi:MAG: hypothetical protein ACE5I7_13765 [Candidatus Binatia bacterium]
MRLDARDTKRFEAAEAVANGPFFTPAGRPNPYSLYDQLRYPNLQES